MKNLAVRAVRAMEDDNGCEFPCSLNQLIELDVAFARMQAAGATIDDAAIDLIAAGEQGEADDRFMRFDGYADVQRILGAIFNGDDS